MVLLDLCMFLIVLHVRVLFWLNTTTLIDVKIPAQCIEVQCPAENGSSASVSSMSSVVALLQAFPDHYESYTALLLYCFNLHLCGDQ